MAIMAQVLGGGPARGELLTFLFFDPEFTSALIEAGRGDAEAWLARHPDLWCSDSSHDFDIPDRASARDREVALLEEFRTRRR